MRLEHSFTVPVSAPRVWAVLLDLTRVSGFVPGASLIEANGDRFTGLLRIRVGPFEMAYRGSGHVVVRDEGDLRFMIELAGQDVRGGGTLAATMVTKLHPQANGTTRVQTGAELAVTGRLTRSGGRVVHTAAMRLIGRFADDLVAELGRDPQAVLDRRHETPTPVIPSAGGQWLVPCLFSFALGGLVVWAMLELLS